MSRWTGLALFVLLLSCRSIDPPSRAFVSLHEGSFTVDGRPFFPLVVNYGASLRASGDGLWATPASEYAVRWPDTPVQRATDIERVRADMEMIHDMGFNTVRLVGFGEAMPDSTGLRVRAKTPFLNDTLVDLLQDGHYAAYLAAIGQVFDAARDAGLRVILLATIHPDEPQTEAHFTRIADHFRADTVVLAYDLFNEPLYFDKPERPKTEVRDIVEHWRRVTREHAPHQLTTIGLTGMREVFEWDPNMLLVDFVSFHPYEYEPEQVRNEFRWYGENLRVPWIIGETAIPADDDSVPYERQQEFAHRTLRQAVACGAKGYSWWQYKDVDWDYFHSDFMGVLSREGATRTRKSGFLVEGTLKPVVEEFRSFDPTADAGECVHLPNYYNYSDHRVARLTGRLVDEQGRPVASGVVIGWNRYWGRSYHTVSRADGSFELRGDLYFFHWMASATMREMVRGDCAPNAYRTTGEDSIPTYYFGDIVLEKLPFAATTE